MTTDAYPAIPSEPGSITRDISGYFLCVDRDGSRHEYAARHGIDQEHPTTMDIAGSSGPVSRAARVYYCDARGSWWALKDPTGPHPRRIEGQP